VRNILNVRNVVEIKANISWLHVGLTLQLLAAGMTHGICSRTTSRPGFNFCWPGVNLL